jgi:hypothetical protein
VDLLGARTITLEMAEIGVTPEGAGRFRVDVREGDSGTRHSVTASSEDLARLGAGYETPEAFLRACFEFLLERESKESILRSFDVSLIGRYFPEFESTIRRL